MTIRKGEPWGEAVASPANLRVVPTDRDAREWVVHHRSADRSIPPVGLGGGDLARTLGGGTPGRFPGTVTMAPVDIMRVVASGETTWCVAHVVARRSWWRGEVVLAMNAQFLGDADVAPRSHPNDGRIDAVRIDPDMGVRARFQARRRARTGTHVPHPSLATSSAATHRWEFARPLVIWVDGVRWRTSGSLELAVEPDALTVYA